MRMIKLLTVVCLLSMLIIGCADSGAGPDAETENETNAEIGTTGATLPEESHNASNEEAVWNEMTDPSDVIVPILMFHDVKTYEGGMWSMSAGNFRKTLGFLVEKGYTPISFEQLVDYVDGIAGLPAKPVCITLDDGYFSNYRNVLPAATELEVPVTVFMNCKTIRGEGTVPDTNEKALYKMSAAELEIMEASPYVRIQSHSFGLHGENTYYSDVVRDNSLPLETEGETAYKEIFAKDCELEEVFLEHVGVNEHMVFSYPGGKHHEWAEEVLRERGYRVSITTDYGHVNLVEKGKPESLYLLGRMNVNDETTEAQLLRYLERDR